ncbi:hypothetical protein [Acanthopleuribacter pedis]|uniref:MalT-like TPR region domain-containing protein n=1 Tax=Acanthopleuribacter pedis TaxID=442870 RepID=A0A8J7QAZ3_9BACT|nr:hypothetical protein [Acanthopleuribacter pedis]MBO1321117.1 hypothetical protein [Acanthopleuribacter pedis]
MSDQILETVFPARQARALQRFVTRMRGQGFKLLLAEMATVGDRRRLKHWLEQQLEDNETLCRIDVSKLPAQNLWAELKDKLAETPQAAFLMVEGWEHHLAPEKPGVEERQPALIQQLNVQRDLFVRDLAVPWIMVIHPYTQQLLDLGAPDFSDFVALRIEALPQPKLTIPVEAFRSDPVGPGHSSFIVDMLTEPGLKRIWKCLMVGAYTEAKDLIETYRLNHSSEPPSWQFKLTKATYLRLSETHYNAMVSLEELSRHPEVENIPSHEFMVRSELIRMFITNGNYQIAINESKKLSSKLSDPEHFSFREMIHQTQAEAYALQERTAKAIEVLTDSNTRIKQTLGNSSLLLGQGFSLLAFLALKQGNLSLAAKESAAGLEIISRRCSVKDILLCYAVRIHAMVLSSHQETKQALSLLDDYLKNLSSESKNHLYQITIWLAKAQVFYKQGDLSSVQEILEQALKGAHRLVGHHHPLYLEVITALCTVMDLRGFHGDSWKLLFKTKESTHSPSIVINLWKNLLDAIGDHQAAKGDLLTAEITWRNEAGASMNLEHPRLASLLCKISIAQTSQGRAQEGRSSCQKALDISNRVYGNKSNESGHILTLLAFLTHQLDDPNLTKAAQLALERFPKKLTSSKFGISRDWLETLAMDKHKLKKNHVPFEEGS